MPRPPRPLARHWRLPGNREAAPLTPRPLGHVLLPSPPPQRPRPATSGNSPLARFQWTRSDVSTSWPNGGSAPFPASPPVSWIRARGCDHPSRAWGGEGIDPGGTWRCLDATVRENKTAPGVTLAVVPMPLPLGVFYGAQGRVSPRDISKSLLPFIWPWDTPARGRGSADFG